jgi:phenylpyruvate tautomerase PptA (4-oxalocrotonate tautomerase family)
MPFVRTAVRQGTDASQKQLIVESIHNALVQAIGMPEDELFNLVSEYNASDFLYSRTFNGVARSDHLVVVEITMRRGRSDAMKKALYAEIAANLEKRAGVSSKDVFIFTHENDYSDWSVGNG